MTAQPLGRLIPAGGVMLVELSLFHGDGYDGFVARFLSQPEPAKIRTFLDAGLRESLDRALATIPADHHAAFIGVATPTGAQAMFVAKLPAGWSVMGLASKEWNGKLDAQVVVGWSG